MTKLLRIRYSLVVFATLLIGESAPAQGLLDYIRDYDLNDYALGLTISTSQNPYLDGENSVIAYPVLTSFRDAAFTDDWLLLREGDMGIRWVTQNDWEFALIGRIQTLGLGTSDSPRLEGLDDRKWGLEMGPMAGWRGWPVHINLKTYTEVFSHHDGLISHLLFSLPREHERGYLVPGIEFIHQTSDYANYYFGVSASEATPTRPEYHPGDTLNTALRLRWGYSITENWLLYGNLGLEFLDSAISNSPIVEEDQLWSASISIAYNNNIFQPSEFRRGRTDQPRFEIRLGAFRDAIDSNIVRDASDGSDGTDIDLEDLLGLSDQETLLEVDAIYRFNSFHRIEFGYLGSARNGSAVLTNDIMFGDRLFLEGTTVNSEVDTQITRVAYAFSVINDTQKEVGVMAGLHLSRVKTKMSSVETGQTAVSNAATPLPVIGLHGSVSLGRKAALTARIQFFRMDFDRYEGSLSYATLDLQRQIGDVFKVGLGYNYYALNLDSRDNDVRGTMEVLHHGPLLFVTAGF
jgi:outer membrane protein